LLLEEFVLRHGHDDLARLVLDEGGECEHGAIGEAAEQADKIRNLKRLGIVGIQLSPANDRPVLWRPTYLPRVTITFLNN